MKPEEFCVVILLCLLPEDELYIASMRHFTTLTCESRQRTLGKGKRLEISDASNEAWSIARCTARRVNILRSPHDRPHERARLSA